MKLAGHRVIWAFAFGYFFFYAPYAAVTKVVNPDLVMLPYVVLGTILTAAIALTLLRWWKYATPFAGPAVVLSGLGTAVIIACTTIAYTFHGVSILLALLLMRGGVLVMAPLIDRAHGRNVRWFSWAALALSFCAIAIALTDVTQYQMSLAVLLNLAAYLSGYCLRLPCMTHCAKTDNLDCTRRWLVQELLVAMIALATLPIGMALFRRTPMQASTISAALLIGVLYALLYFFGTLIYLDRRENTFSVPLNRGTSLLSGLVAAAAIHAIYGAPLPPASQFIAAIVILAALLLLSPLHHYVEDAFAILARRPLRGTLLLTEPRILFVCSANTCRSPMAAAIANAELGLRLGIPLDAVMRSRGYARSAGLNAIGGTAMTEPTQSALGALDIPPTRHEARNVTRETIDAADVIYCMTRAQCDALARAFPDAATRARCLDPHADIADPVGQPAEIYVDVARRLRTLIRMRFDELGLAAVRVGGLR